MTAEIINLRQARKRRSREARAAEAAENRARFGQTRAERARDALSEARARRSLDGHCLEPTSNTPSGDQRKDAASDTSTLKSP
jgi:hypothetical protein